MGSKETEHVEPEEKDDEMSHCEAAGSQLLQAADCGTVSCL